MSTNKLDRRFREGRNFLYVFQKQDRLTRTCCVRVFFDQIAHCIFVDKPQDKTGLGLSQLSTVPLPQLCLRTDLIR